MKIEMPIVQQMPPKQKPLWRRLLAINPNLGLGSYFLDFSYRHGFLLLLDCTRIFEGRGKAFADALLERITTKIAKIHIPGLIAHGILTVAGWPAWWANSAKRQQALNNPNLVHLV